jgi:hypothetical protein
MREWALAVAMLATVACERQPNPQPAPSPPVPTPAASAAVPRPAPPTALPTAVGTPSIGPSAPPTIAPSPPPTPSPAPSPAYRFVYTPPPALQNAPPGMPQILEIDMTDQIVHQNSDVSLRVLTSPAVASVVAAAMGREAAIPQVGSGVFAAQSHIPGVPFFLLNRVYNIEIRAATPDGHMVSVTLPIRLVR